MFLITPKRRGISEYEHYLAQEKLTNMNTPNEGFRSCAEWPKGTVSETDNITRDNHDTQAQAEGVCDRLRTEGFGGEHKIFPIRTWTEPITALESYNTKCQKLHKLIKAGVTDAETDALRDVMDVVWNKLTEAERDEANRMSAFYASAD